MATVENNSRPTEDKIDRPLYVTIFIILAAAFSISIQCILKSEKTAVLEISAVGTDETCYRLPYRTGRVLERNILGIEIGSIDIAGRRTGCPLVLTEHILLIRIIVVRNNGTFLPKQGNINLTLRYYQFFFVHPTAYQYRSTYIFAEIGNSIDSLLYGKEITATVLCHYIIVIAHVFCQFRYDTGNGIHCKPGYNPCAIHIQVRIILTSFRHGRYYISRYPHKKFLGFLRSHTLHKLMGNFIHIHKRNIQLFRHIPRRIQIRSMRIYQFIPFLRNSGLRCITLCIRINPLTNIILNNSLCHNLIIGNTEITPYNGIEKYRNTTFLTCFIHKFTKVGIECRSRVSVAVCLRLFVIMPELDKNIVAFLNQG